MKVSKNDDWLFSMLRWVSSTGGSVCIFLILKRGRQWVSCNLSNREWRAKKSTVGMWKSWRSSWWMFATRLRPTSGRSRPSRIHPTTRWLPWRSPSFAKNAVRWMECRVYSGNAVSLCWSEGREECHQDLVSEYSHFPWPQYNYIYLRAEQRRDDETGVSHRWRLVGFDI